MFYKPFHIALIACLLLSLIGLIFLFNHISFLNSVINEQHKALMTLSKEVEAIKNNKTIDKLKMKNE